MECERNLQGLTRDQDRYSLAVLLAQFHGFFGFVDLLCGLLTFNCLQSYDLTFLACTAIKDATYFTNFFGCVSVVASQHPELDASLAKIMNA